MTHTRTITSARHAAILLAHPLRPRILARARVPISAADLARLLDQPRQRVNYHVRQLASGGFLDTVVQQKKRNMIEQQYVATAHAYVIDPRALGDAAPAGELAPDSASADDLVALCARAQTEVAAVMGAASEAGVRLRTLAMQRQLHFETGAQRSAFLQTLEQAVDDVVMRHTSPSVGRGLRLIIGCYPAPGGTVPSRPL